MQLIKKFRKRVGHCIMYPKGYKLQENDKSTMLDFSSWIRGFTTFLIMKSIIPWKLNLDQGNLNRELPSIIWTIFIFRYIIKSHLIILILTFCCFNIIFHIVN